MRASSPWRYLVLSLLGAVFVLPARGSANAYIEMMTVHLDAPVTQLPPPDDAEARKKAFGERNSPAQVKKLADELFAIWDWEQKGSRRMAITRRLNARKTDITALYEQGKYREALDAFRAYFFAKVLLLWDDEKGLVSRDFEGRFGRDFTIQNYEGNATLLMDNIYQARTSKETVHLGEMGALRWDWEPGGLQNPWYTPAVFEYFASDSNFSTLWWKFVDTGERAYLDKYLAYYEDYTLNYRFQENLNPLNLDYGKQGHGNCENFIHAISEIARVLPPGGEGFPATTLARILIRQLTVTLPQSLYYNREQGGNHSCGAVHVHQYLSSFLFDFKIARLLEHESRRQFEIYSALVDLPDGSMYGRSAGYSRHEFTENSIYVNKIREADLNWLTPSEELEFQVRLADRVFWYFNLFDASGEHVNGVSAGRRNMDFSGRVNLIAKFQPQALKDPSLQALAIAILRNQTGPDWTGKTYTSPDNPLLQGGLNAQGPPPYTSISFPYNHISIMRSGWDMNEDQTGAFLHSSEQGLDGGLFLRGKNCNSLTISAFNQAMLVNGIEYAYNYVRSPIQVDGQDQFARAGITGHGRKGEHNPGLVRISPWRNHHSAAFDVAEGNYDGIYSESPDHEPILYHYETNLKVLKGALEGDLSHRRIVQFVKELGVWFVLDIMEADRPRAYRQQWWMSKLTERNPDGYKEEWVSADPDRSMFYSHADSMANISMYHVGPVLLGADDKQTLSHKPVKTYIKQEEWYKGYRADRKPGVEFLHLTTDWQSEAGRSQLITVIYPRRQGQSEQELQVERAENGREVTVTTKSGDRMHFAADGLESTLTVRKAGEGGERGLVLTDEESYEFTVTVQSRRECFICLNKSRQNWRSMVPLAQEAMCSSPDAECADEEAFRPADFRRRLEQRRGPTGAGHRPVEAGRKGRVAGGTRRAAGAAVSAARWPAALAVVCESHLEAPSLIGPQARRSTRARRARTVAGVGGPSRRSHSNQTFLLPGLWPYAQRRRSASSASPGERSPASTSAHHRVSAAYAELPSVCDLDRSRVAGRGTVRCLWPRCAGLGGLVVGRLPHEQAQHRDVVGRRLRSPDVLGHGQSAGTPCLRRTGSPRRGGPGLCARATGGQHR